MTSDAVLADAWDAPPVAPRGVTCLVTPTLKNPHAAREDRPTPIERVTVQLIGPLGESMSVAVIPRETWMNWLRPVLLAGTAHCSLTFEIKE